MRNICLIACAKSKLTRPAKAEDMYISPIFQIAKHAAKTFDGWAILSAKLGVVQPHEFIAPYEQTLSKMSPQERKAWANHCKRALVTIFPNSTFTILAGKQYATAAHGLAATFPLSSATSMGDYLRKLKAYAKARNGAA